MSRNLGVERRELGPKYDATVLNPCISMTGHRNKGRFASSRSGAKFFVVNAALDGPGLLEGDNRGGVYIPPCVWPDVQGRVN